MSDALDAPYLDPDEPYHLDSQRKALALLKSRNFFVGLAPTAGEPDNRFVVFKPSSVGRNLASVELRHELEDDEQGAVSDLRKLMDSSPMQALSKGADYYGYHLSFDVKAGYIRAEYIDRRLGPDDDDGYETRYPALHQGSELYINGDLNQSHLIGTQIFNPDGDWTGGRSGMQWVTIGKPIANEDGN